jgi:hypothetical protein
MWVALAAAIEAGAALRDRAVVSIRCIGLLSGMAFKWAVPILVRPMFAIRSDMSEMSVSNSGRKSIK